MTPEKRAGFAVVGLGAIAQGSVLPAFARSRRAKLVAVVSRDQRKAARLGGKFKAQFHYAQRDYDDCLANPAISAVYIATPPGAHEDLTVRAAQAGKHVLCEKPLAATPEQSARMVEACRRSGVQLMTAYRKQFEPSCLHLKKLIRCGAFGRIDSIHSSFSELYVPGKSLAWLIDAHLAGGGPLMDLGIYCINTTLWLLDENPCEVVAWARNRHSEHITQVEQSISFQLRFPSGVVLHGSSSYAAALSSILYVQGSQGWASLCPAFPFDEERVLVSKINGRTTIRKFRIGDEFLPEIEAFASAIQGQSVRYPNGAQGHRDVCIIAAIYDSVRQQKPLDMHYGSNAFPGAVAVTPPKSGTMPNPLAIDRGARE